VAVSDDGQPVSSAGVMRRAMQYAATFGLPVIDHCEDLTLSRRAAAHEGPVSAWTGIRAQPASAEVVMLARDLTLCAETGARYHAAHVSCAESVDLVRRAKARGLPVTAEVTVQHVTLNDESTKGYDPNVKCNPPLRSETDRAACLAGLLDGTLDALVTDHAPHAPMDKAVEYEEAPFGVIGLETALPVMLLLVSQGKLPLATLVERLTAGPARVLGLPGGDLAVGSPADVTLVNPELAWNIQPEHFLSRSRNTPFGGWDVRGRVVTTVVGGRVVYRWPEGLAPAR
jgi:dihydroorotase